MTLTEAAETMTRTAVKQWKLHLGVSITPISVPLQSAFVPKRTWNITFMFWKLFHQVWTYSWHQYWIRCNSPNELGVVNDYLKAHKNGSVRFARMFRCLCISWIGRLRTLKKVSIVHYEKTQSDRDRKKGNERHNRRRRKVRIPSKAVMRWKEPLCT